MYKTSRVFLFPKTQTISTSKGTIWPYCAESAVKLQSINHLGALGVLTVSYKLLWYYWPNILWYSTVRLLLISLVINRFPHWKSYRYTMLLFCDSVSCSCDVFCIEGFSLQKWDTAFSISSLILIFLTAEYFWKARWSSFCTVIVAKTQSVNRESAVCFWCMSST